MDFKGWLTNPYVIGGGVILGLLLLSSRGSSGGSMADVTLASQQIASDTNIQLASIQAQRDVAMGSIQSEMAQTKAQLSTAMVGAMTDQYLARLQSDLVQTEISAGLQATQHANVLGAQVALAQIQNETRAIDTAGNLQLHALNIERDLQSQAIGLAAHELNVMGGLGHAELAYRREVEAPLATHALNLEYNLMQAALPIQANLMSEQAHLTALVQNTQTSAQEHMALMGFQAHKNEIKAQSGFGGFLNTLGGAFGQAFGSSAGYALGGRL